MKRKFLSIVSLFLAVMMILPMGVFVYADGEGGGEGGTPVTEALKIYCDEKDVSGTSFEKYIPCFFVTVCIYAWSSAFSGPLCNIL